MPEAKNGNRWSPNGSVAFAPKLCNTCFKRDRMFKAVTCKQDKKTDKVRCPNLITPQQPQGAHRNRCTCDTHTAAVAYKLTLARPSAVNCFNGIEV